MNWLSPLAPVARRIAVNRASAQRKTRWLRNPANRAAYNAKRRKSQ